MKPLLNLDQNFLNALGVVDWGYTEESKPRSFEKYSDWVERGDHGSLSYLADHRKDLRKDLSSVQETFQSALVFLFSYQADKLALENFYQSKESNGLKMAGYALSFEGLDYHHVLKENLEKIGEQLGVGYRISLDIQPVLERDLAYRAGLGWFGKNSMLINQKHGSFNMIGALLLDQKLELPLGEVQVDHCGQCRACEEVCPTDAIDLEQRQIIANKCISTFTIELFKDGESPKGYENSSEIFGCDLCQDVCPWNKRRVREEEVFPNVNWPGEKGQEILDFFLRPKVEDISGSLEKLSNKAYTRLFKGTSLERTGRVGILKNLRERG